MIVSWTLLIAVATVLALAWTAALARRREVRRTAEGLRERRLARERGSHKALLQSPIIDLTRCLGCGTCIRACPEEGVLTLVHGQAQVVHGARCVGHAKCASECPTGAITVTLADLSSRSDIPALTEELEATGQEGVFLAGEVTGFALIRTAVAQGSEVAREVSRRIKALASQTGPDRSDRATSDVRAQQANGQKRPQLDLVVVGAGPAGIACSLEASRLGLSFMTIEQESLGGTVSRYPRRKLVMTQPVELPLHGRLKRPAYLKEELMELWEQVVQENKLPIRTGVRLDDVERLANGNLIVYTDSGSIESRNVCLALGRRGTPRKLGVPGEDLPKVAYSLMDANSYTNRRILVVGGGDSAIEAALGLAQQDGNQVTLSYRKHAFFRLKPRNENLLGKAADSGRIALLLESQVTRITEKTVELRHGSEQNGHKDISLPNDEVFVFAGGVPPFAVLERAGVSFSPEDRADTEEPGEQGSGLFRALTSALAVTVLTLGWVALHRNYYGLESTLRVQEESHRFLSPTGTIGLGLGVGAVALIIVNLLYLLRRNVQRLSWAGSLSTWLSAHMVTGSVALLFALLHAGLAPEHTIGGHALIGLAILVASGAIGRYIYAYAPRKANGGEVTLEEVQRDLVALSADWDRCNRDFGLRIRDRVQELVDQGRWNGTFGQRVRSLIRAQFGFRALHKYIRKEGRREEVGHKDIEAICQLAKRAQRTALLSAHFEELRALLVTWRWIHRWVALSMVILVAAHVITAMRYGGVFR